MNEHKSSASEPGTLADYKPGSTGEIQESEELHEPKLPWNPLILCWLGLLFSPLWLGIITAMNARRLNQGFNIYLPIGLTIAWLTITIGVFIFSIENDLAELLFSLLTICVFWIVCLRGQFNTYLGNDMPRSASYWKPSIFGSPMLGIMILGFYLSWTPQTARQACEDYLAANTTEESRQFVSLKMYPVLAQMQRLEELAKNLPTSDDEEPIQIEFLGEQVDAKNSNRCQVKNKILFSNGTDSLLLDTTFELSKYNHKWKIDLWCATAMNNARLESGKLSMAEFFKSIADEMQRELDKDKKPAKSLGQ